MDVTTCAYRISNIFETYSGLIDDRPLWTTWQRTFDSEASDERTYLGIAGVVTALGDLRSQVNSSHRLTESSRAIADRVISQLSECVKPGHFHVPASQLKNCCDTDKIGIVQMLGNSLAAEYPEPKLAGVERGELLKEIQDLADQVRAASLTPTIRDQLLRHIAAMAWALERIENLGFDEVYAVMMREMSRARTSSAASKPAKGLGSRIIALGTKVVGMMRTADKAVQVANKMIELVDEAQNLIGS